MIETILLGLVILICGCLFLHAKALGGEQDEMEEAIRRLTAENEAIRARMRVYEKRLHQQSKPDKLIITHEYSDENAPDYGNF